MSNPLFNQLGGMRTQGNMGQMVTAFHQFKNSFTGDPKQQVQNLLNSGQMSQQQYNQYSEMAKQLMNILK